MCAKRIVSRTNNELSKLSSQERGKKNQISKREKDICKYYSKENTDMASKHMENNNINCYPGVPG